MSDDTREARTVSEHYRRPGLTAAILDALRAAGKDPDSLSARDLAPLDQFHTRGRAATLELARLANLGPGTRVLDVGGGLGGPARTLAGELGCCVEVLDATEEYCRSGAALTARTRLDDRVTFTHGSALDMPYPDAGFDAVWTQHVSMNVPDKGRLYAEIQRTLKPGGRLALHEVAAGPVSPIHFPVPWARAPEASFLQAPTEMRAMIVASGLEELAWSDETTSSLRWFERRLAATPPDLPLGLHLLLGENLNEMLKNQALNLRERRICVLQAVFQRPR